jgi:phosphonate transport system substrate-binding protein
MKRIALRVGLALVAAGLLGASPAPAEPPLVFGVLNQQSPALTAERWNPILHYLTSVTGIPLSLKMGANVDETNAMMARGAFDLMFTNHVFQSEFDGLGYRVIARWAGDPIRTVIAAPADSPIRDLRELEGKAVAFPSKEAFVGYAVPLVALRSARVNVVEVFAGNQEGAMAQLKARRVAAAAVNSRFLAQYAEREGVHFREIYVSEGYPELAIIAHPRLPAATVQQIRAALIGMAADPAAAPILARVKFQGFAPASDRDYDGVRRIYRLTGQ